MKRNFWLVLIMIINTATGSIAQKIKVDTVLDRGIYKSFFNYKLREPLYVTYALFKGGGDCDRGEEGFDFKVDDFKRTAVHVDYKASGFDKGHLANAEDFAYDCEDEELTFRYYNCVPQTTKMNRGVWKAGKHCSESNRKQKHFL